MATVSGSERLLRLFGLAFARLLYRVTPSGVERLPAGGFLLLPNHITWVDAIILSLACPRPIRFIIDEGVYSNRFLNPFLRALSCIPITGRKAKDGMREAIARIRDGEVVCLFPEGELSRAKVLGVAMPLARHLQKTCPDRRIGVVLPPGKGGLVANLAVILAGKMPVNLNFTSLREAIQSASEQAGLRTTITARQMAKRLEDFPWTENVIHLDEALPPMTKKILLWWIGALVVPREILASILNLLRTG